MNTKLILDFLIELSRNNNVDWMHAHKSLCDEARGEFNEIVQELINRLTLIDKSLLGLSPKECVFRLPRDTRFSLDKQPYKNHFGAYIAPGGKKSIKAGYYLHIQPGDQSLIAAGVHCLPNDALKVVRQEIESEGETLDRLLKDKKFKENFLFEGDSLKTMPRDFKAGGKFDKYVKMKNFDIFKSYEDSAVIQSGTYVDEVFEKFQLVKPINDFFNEALYNY